MKSFTLTILTILGATFSFGQCSDLFFSEYIEGSSNNKAIEIYNPTSAAIDLSDYRVYLATNGSAVPTSTFNGAGMISAGGVYVIANSSANATILGIADTLHSVVNYNGDDAVWLVKISTGDTLDIIGVIGTDPGTNWPVGTGATSEFTLVRMVSIQAGTMDWVQGATEWDVFPQNMTDSLGAHTMIACGSCINTSSTISPTTCTDYTAPDMAVYTTSGVYTAVIPNAAGCDSTITINLTVGTATSSTISPTVCTTYTAPDGATYSTSGIYTATIPNAQGCDSVITIDLTVSTITTSSITEVACDSYTAPDMAVYTTSGVYTATIPSSTGCDSVITINLTVNAATASSITEVACDSYTAPDAAVYTTSGVYTATIPNAAGCDSVIIIDLTINTPTTNSMSEVACDSFTLNGMTYTSTGVYTQTLTNAAGCDSTITLTLEITMTPAAPLILGATEYCEGDAITALSVGAVATEALIISGVADATLVGGVPKAVEFYVLEDIADLSTYGFGSANNGGGTDGQEFTFPAVAVTAGTYLHVATDSANFLTFFGFYPDYTDPSAGNVNGDDAIELFHNGNVIDVFGDINVDGSGQPWEYLDGWAYRNTNTAPNGGVFAIGEWTFSGIDVLDGAVDNATSAMPFPIETYTYTAPVATINWYDDAALTSMVGTGSTFTPTEIIGTTAYYATATVNGTSTCASPASQIDITFNALPSATVTQVGTLLTADLSGATYQWIDCGTSTPIVGATSQSFTPAVTGNYAVEVTDGNCSETSSCYLVDYTGINELIAPTKELVKIVDLMGRETEFTSNTPLIFIYSDGTTERVFQMEK